MAMKRQDWKERQLEGGSERKAEWVNSESLAVYHVGYMGLVQPSL